MNTFPGRGKSSRECCNTFASISDSRGTKVRAGISFWATASHAGVAGVWARRTLYAVPSLFARNLPLIAIEGKGERNEKESNG